MYFYYVYNFIFFVVAFLDDKNKQQQNTLYRLKPLKKTNVGHWMPTNPNIFCGEQIVGSNST